jgi:hypothetical protein
VVAKEGMLTAKLGFAPLSLRERGWGEGKFITYHLTITHQNSPAMIIPEAQYIPSTAWKISA